MEEIITQVSFCDCILLSCIREAADIIQICKR